MEEHGKPSPFSILRTSLQGSAADSLDQELRRSKDQGHTRATFLRQLHLRKKIEENPILQKEAYREVMQSMMHERRSQERSIRENSVQTSKMQQYVGRVRNRRGDYDPLDASSVLMNDT